MEIIRLHETVVEVNSRRIREVFLGTAVSACGMAEFKPGLVAHEGERHVHDYDEVFVILSGEITVPVAGQPGEVARAGDWIFVEAGLEHHLTNHTILPCTAMFLVLERREAN